jgi:hypothetical protein
MLILLSRFLVSGLHLADGLKISHSVLELALHRVPLASAEVALDIRGVEFDSFTTIEYADGVRLHPVMSERAVAIVDSLLGWRHLAEDSFGVHVNGLGMFVLGEKSVSLGLELFSFFLLFLVPDLFLFSFCGPVGAATY